MNTATEPHFITGLAIAVNRLYQLRLHIAQLSHGIILVHPL
jgi:hypothetical protein